MNGLFGAENLARLVYRPPPPPPPPSAPSSQTGDLPTWDPFALPETRKGDHGEDEWFTPAIGIYGDSDSGKSYLAKHLLHCWSHRYSRVFVRTGGDKIKWQRHLPRGAVGDAPDDAFVARLEREQSEFLKHSIKSLNARCAVVNDDLVQDRDIKAVKRAIEWEATAARHYAVQPIFCVHQRNIITPAARQSIKVHIVVEAGSGPERKLLREIVAPGLSDREFSMYVEKFCVGHQALVFDKVAKRAGRPWISVYKAPPPPGAFPRDMVLGSREFWGAEAKDGVDYPALWLYPTGITGDAMSDENAPGEDPPGQTVDEEFFESFREFMVFRINAAVDAFKRRSLLRTSNLPLPSQPPGDDASPSSAPCAPDRVLPSCSADSE